MVDAVNKDPYYICGRRVWYIDPETYYIMWTEIYETSGRFWKCFINMTDERYTKFVKPNQPGSTLLFNLAGINNMNKTATGTVKVKLVNSKGDIFSEQHFTVKLESFLRTDIPVSLVLPSKAGGYVLIAEFTPENGQPVISRRFLKIGQSEEYSYFNIDSFQTKNTKK